MSQFKTVVKNPANNQEVFDYVVDKLRKQGCQAKDDTTHFCQYRAIKNGETLKCAAGHLILDDEYTSELDENGSLGQPFVINFFKQRGYDVDFLYALQDIHDNLTPNCWEREWKSLAETYKLRYTPKF